MGTDWLVRVFARGGEAPVSRCRHRPCLFALSVGVSLCASVPTYAAPRCRSVGVLAHLLTRRVPGGWSRRSFVSVCVAMSGQSIGWARIALIELLLLSLAGWVAVIGGVVFVRGGPLSGRVRRPSFGGKKPLGVLDNIDRRDETTGNCAVLPSLRRPLRICCLCAPDGAMDVVFFSVRITRLSLPLSVTRRQSAVGCADCALNHRTSPWLLPDRCCCSRRQTQRSRCRSMLDVR